VTVPDYESMMLPLLRAVEDGQPHRVRDLVRVVADALNVSTLDRVATTRGGGQTQLDSRARWAKVYLARAGLLQTVGRGEVQLTSEGRKVLAESPARVDVAFLSKYPSFRQFRSGTAGQPGRP
jgi:restriction system protein